MAYDFISESLVTSVQFKYPNDCVLSCDCALLSDLEEIIV